MTAPSNTQVNTEASTPVATPANLDTSVGWQARVEGEVAALAVRGGDAPVVAVGTEDGTCWLLDTTGAVTAHADSGVDVPTDLTLHPTRDRVAVSGARGYATWEPDASPIRHDRGWCSAVTYNRLGDLAVASGKHVLIHHDVHRDAHETPYVSAPAPSTVTGVAWTPQSSRVSYRVAASAYGGVYVYDGEHPGPVHTYPYAGSHLAVAVNPNGRWVCSGNQDASVHIWRKTRNDKGENDELEMAGYPEKVTRLAFDSTGRWFANNGAPELTVWDFLGKGPRGRKPRLLTGHTRVTDISWHPGTSNLLASVGAEGTARIWNLTGMAAGRSRGATRVLPFDDALAVRWLDPDRLVVARTDGAIHLLSWPVR